MKKFASNPEDNKRNYIYGGWNQSNKSIIKKKIDSNISLTYSKNLNEKPFNIVINRRLLNYLSNSFRFIVRKDNIEQKMIKKTLKWIYLISF